MAEYIDRDAFITQERAWYCENCDMRKNSKGKTVYEIGEAPCRACDIGTMLDAVEDYPAADVVERKTGTWLMDKMTRTCSSDRGEACGLFGDGWDSPFQYEDKDGDIVGCYIDRHFIEKTDEKYQEYLLQQAASYEAWMLETEKAEED